MSEKYFLPGQPGEQQAAPNLAFEETRPPVTQNRSETTPIRTLHIIILGGLGAIGPLSTDMYLPALPALSHDLGATMSQTQLTLSAGILGLALGQVIAGPLSDTLGRRRPLLVGIAAFLVVSLLCLVAPSIEVLTLLRFGQGVAGAAGIALALAIASDLYHGVTLARSLALLMLVNALAPIVAPVIGSQLLTFTSWRGIFVTLALIGLVYFLAVFFGLGETLPPNRRQRGGLASSLRTLRELLADRRFVGYALSSGFAFAAGIVYISVSPFILQNVYGLSPQLFGLVFGLNALGLALMAQISGRLVSQVSSQKLLMWGVATIAFGGLALLVVVLAGIGLIGVLFSFFIIVASLGLIAPNATTLALTNIRAAGSASALLGVLQFSIGAVAAPLIGLGGSTSVVPMAIAIAVFSLTTLLTFIFLCRPAPMQSE